MFTQRQAWVWGWLAGILTSSAYAHFPIIPGEGGERDPNNAVLIEDASISQVVYYEVTEEAPRLWVKFDLELGQEIYAQLGVPVIDRLAEFRPAMVVLGPGMPEVDLPFDAPDGLGGILLTTDDIDEPEFFHEEFTGTESWIFGEILDSAPEAGTYYLVAYVPSDEVGKLWVAVGRREVFDPADFGGLAELVPLVSEFHETDAVGLLTPFLPCFAPLALAGAGLWGATWYLRRR